jgi:hypothetical protein
MKRELLAAVATVTLLGAGCSNTPAESKADGTGANTSTVRDEAVRFAECMRDNGVSAFPDPDASGELTIDGIANDSSVDPDSAAFKKADRACKKLQPPGFTGRKRSTSQQQAALEFAQCMRENGVKDFPDPAAGEPLVNTNLIPSSATKGGMSILNAAMHTCGEVWGDKVGVHQ